MGEVDQGAAVGLALRGAQQAGAVIIDTRTAEQRAESAHIPGAFVIDRTVLEWRLDPTSEARIAQATSHEIEVIVHCMEGYTSSLAADALRDIGLHRSADLDGGILAWKAAGLPTVPGPTVDYRGEDLAQPAG